jgi:hypothetical protein
MLEFGNSRQGYDTIRHRLKRSHAGFSVIVRQVYARKFGKVMPEVTLALRDRSLIAF